MLTARAVKFKFSFMTRLLGKPVRKASKATSHKPGAQASLARRAASATLVFRDIGELYTLEGAAKKNGRRCGLADLGRIEKAALVVSAGRVIWTGRERDIPKELLKKKTTVAFVESHTHLIFAGNRAGEFERRNQGESYQSIAKSGGGILATVLPTRAASVKELARIGQDRAERFLRQGATTIEAKSGYGLTVEAELKLLRAAGLIKRARIVRTFLGAHAIPREAASADAYVTELIEKALPLIARDKLARRADVFTEDGYFSKALSRRYLKAAQALGLEAVVHADQLTRSGGAELAVELRARSADHLLCINDQDIAALAASDVTCVLLPSSDLYMNSAYPPARKLIEQGARVALATDFNPGSAPSQDLQLAGVLARIHMKMSLPEVITAYTVGGAFALGLGAELGALTPGRLADFSVLSGPIEELFLEIGRTPVARVYSAGVRLV
jgi:imidazolonepropionase